MSVIDLKSVTKTYPGGEGQPLPVLGGIDLSVGEGESVSVVGSSGCGKSTLLNIIGTLDHPDSGTVELFGKPVPQGDEDALSALRARHIGFIFQLHHLLPQCSVLENVLVPGLALPAGDRGDEAHAVSLLERVGLGGRLDHRPAQLSGGERQRVAVVRALANRPSLLLADEPTGALDQETAAGLADLFIELGRDEGVAVVLVTHDPGLAARMGTTYAIEGGHLDRR